MPPYHPFSATVTHGRCKARRFAADQFQFPACEACNSRYSDLEGRTKANMTKLLNEQSLSAVQWDDLLDWFDKVRIGLFIGNMILNKDLPVPNPKFFIDQRIGAKDRCVLIYPNRADRVGLGMIGAGDPVFFHLPTSFMLLVNKLLFVNLSSDFLLAPRMGFPFPRTIEMEGPRMRADDFTAFLRPKLPFIRFSFYRPVGRTTTLPRSGRAHRAAALNPNLVNSRAHIGLAKL
jgi:hypothetical protein